VTTLDQQIAKIVDEAYNDYASGNYNADKYRCSYFDAKTGSSWDDLSIHTIYIEAYRHAKEKAESNLGKVLGHVDLSKFKKKNSELKRVKFDLKRVNDIIHEHEEAGGKDEGSCYDPEEIRDVDYYKRLGFQI
jgi:hypothetical protein